MLKEARRERSEDWRPYILSHAAAIIEHALLILCVLVAVFCEERNTFPCCTSMHMHSLGSTVWPSFARFFLAWSRDMTARYSPISFRLSAPGAKKCPFSGRNPLNRGVLQEAPLSNFSRRDRNPRFLRASPCSRDVCRHVAIYVYMCSTIDLTRYSTIYLC